MNYQAGRPAFTGALVRSGAPADGGTGRPGFEAGALSNDAGQAC